MSVERTVLETFDRALLREAHNLTRWPELLWQQLYNELQFDAAPVAAALDPELARRTAPGAGAWLRRRTPLGQSGELLATLPGQGHGWINDCAISSDGSFIVGGFADGTLVLWDPATGAELRAFGSRFGVWKCALSPNDSYVIASTEDYTLKLWDTSTGALLCTLGSYDELKLITCAVSPDGSFLASGAPDGKIRIWDPSSGEELQRIEASAVAVHVRAVAPDSSYLVAGGEEEALKLWDPSSGALLQVFGAESSAGRCEVAPDGSYIVSVAGQRLRLWEPDTGEERVTLAEGPFTDCAVAPDGAFILSVSMDTRVMLWDPATEAEPVTLIGHGGVYGFEATCCAVSPDGRFLVSGAKDRTLRIWARPQTDAESVRNAHAGMVGACAISPDGSYAMSSGGTILKLTDLVSGTELAAIETREDAAVAPAGGYFQSIEACAVSPDGSYLVSASGDGLVRLWDAETRRELRTLESPGGMLKDCAVSSDGSFIVACGSAEWQREDGSRAATGTVTIWDRDTGEARCRLAHSDDVRACAVSHDDSYVVSAGYHVMNTSGFNDFTLKLWDPATGAELRTVEPDYHGAEACAVSPDGSCILTAGDNAIRLLDPATGEQLRALEPGGLERIEDCAVSPDGSHLVSAGADGMLRVWDAATGSEVAALPLPGHLYCVAAHPSQPLAVCGDSLGALSVVELVGVDWYSGPA